MATSVIPPYLFTQATPAPSVREPVPRTTREIRNCTDAIIDQCRRASTITNTLVNRLEPCDLGVSREKDELQHTQIMTTEKLEQLQKLIGNSHDSDNVTAGLSNVDKLSVASDESVHAKRAKRPPECLFVLNPRLFSIPVHIQHFEFIALLDSGATENFIARKVVDKLHCRVWKMQSPMYVKVATGEEQRVDSFVKIGVYFNSICLVLSFRIIGMDPEIVLGIPFLERFDPFINWKRKTLRFSHRGRLVLLKSTSPYLAVLEHPLPALLAGKDYPIHEVKDVLEPPKLETFKIKGMMTSTDGMNSAHVDCPGSIFIMHESVSFREDSQELYLLRCTPELNVIQDRNTMPPSIVALLDTYNDVFPIQLPDALPPHREVDHRIDLIPGSIPPACKMYRMAPLEEKELWTQLQAYMKDGKIEPAQSPFGAGVLFARKKDGTLRLCIDYRGLNSITIKDRYPIPRIDEQLDRFAKCSIFSKLDLASGYHQLRVLKDHVPRTAFNTQFGSFQWKVMPFGLTNAPATFQRMMNGILAPYLRSFAQVYLDDIIIYSKDVETHVEHLKKILDVLRKNRLFCKLSKCTFAQTEVEFCGFLVSKTGIRTHPEKITLIQHWPSPKDVSDLKSFLGLCGFYQRFIPRYAAIIACLTSLYKKTSQWKWTSVEEAAFSKIKNELATAVALMYPDFSKQFIIHLDASNLALGATLSQEADDGQLRLLSCTSRKFNVHEVNYPVHEKEQLALVHCLEHWRHYLLGAATIAYTDNIATRFIRSSQNLSSRQIRWLQVIERYNVDIRHIPGVANKAADTLSRLNVLESGENEDDEEAFNREVEHVHGCADNIEPTVDMVNWTNDYAADNELMEFCYHAGTLRPEYRLRNGLIWDGARIVVPHSKVKEILKLHHSSPLSGHLGISKTYDLVNRKYWFPHMRIQVQQFVQECDNCQRNKSERSATRGLLEPLQIPVQKWQSISMDWISGLPISPNYNDSILTIIDRLTHMVHLIPCKTASTALDVAQLLIQHVIRLHGVPRTIHSDRDTRLISRFWKELCRLLGIIPKMTSPYHPSSNGLVERMNRTVEQVLRTTLDRLPLELWEEKLPLVEMCINNSNLFHSEYSPFYLNYGFHPCVVGDVFEQNLSSHVEDVEEFVNRMNKDLERITGIMGEAQRSMKDQADEERLPVEFHPGDLVLFNQSRLEKQSGSRSKFAKLKPKLLGPFTIERFIATNVVELDQPIPGLRSGTVNVCFLTPYRRRALESNADDMIEAHDPSVEVASLELLYHYNSDVMMDPRVFRYACRLLRFRPNIDMFASRRHHQLPRYCSFHADDFAFHNDCFTLNWSQFRPYFNPPWEDIGKMIHKVIVEHVKCMVVVPYWINASWFTLFSRMMVRYWITGIPLYLDESGDVRPSPKWKTCIAILDGSYIQF